MANRERKFNWVGCGENSEDFRELVINLLAQFNQAKKTQDESSIRIPFELNYKGVIVACVLRDVGIISIWEEGYGSLNPEEQADFARNYIKPMSQLLQSIKED